MLQNPQRVDEWFEWALATRNAGNATAVDRQYVLAEAARVVRINREPKKGQKPPGIGAFISNVQKRNWFAAFEDEKKAALAIREMDGP
jgi:hypothetical protein